MLTNLYLVMVFVSSPALVAGPGAAAVPGAADDVPGDQAVPAVVAPLVMVLGIVAATPRGRNRRARKFTYRDQGVVVDGAYLPPARDDPPGCLGRLVVYSSTVPISVNYLPLLVGGAGVLLWPGSVIRFGAGPANASGEGEVGAA